MLVKDIQPRRFTHYALIAAVSVGGLLVGAQVASADSVQVQSYQRASQSEACVAQPGETAWQASWGTDSSWKPSWEQWANGGAGGWTCTRSITWAKTQTAGSGGGGSLTYRVGDIGPGGGLIFLIDNGVHYEMAPKAWPGESGLSLCSTATLVSGATGSALGTGSSNTQAVATSGACNSNAAAAVLAYGGTDSSAGAWFIPSAVELNAMCNFSRNPIAPASPTSACAGSQDVTFAAGDYAFPLSNLPAPGWNYWTSTILSSASAKFQRMSAGNGQFPEPMTSSLHVRPIRTF